MIETNRLIEARAEFAKVKPPLFVMLFAVICGIAVAGACAFCAAQPNKVAVYMRDRHLRSPKWARNWPFAGMVTKDWYPVYLRVVGVGGFFCALTWLALVIRGFSKSPTAHQPTARREISIALKTGSVNLIHRALF